MTVSWGRCRAATDSRAIGRVVSWGSWCLYFPTTYTEEGLVGKLRKTSAGYTPLTASGFPTTYREEGLVGKLSSTSPPPIQKRGSWGSCLKDVRRLSPLCHSAALARRGRGRLRGRRCARARVGPAAAAAAPPTARARACLRLRERDPGPRAERRALASMRRCSRGVRRVPLHHPRTARPSRTKRATSGARAEYSNHRGRIQHPIHARDACGLLTTCAPNVSCVLRWNAS